MKCSNCDAEVGDATTLHVDSKGVASACLVVSKAGKDIAILCSECQKGVLIMKIVLARSEEKGEFTFDGYLPVSSVK